MILITGATGKVGKELVLDLSARRSAFKVMVRSKEAAKDFEAKGIKAVQGDFERPETHAGALASVQTVFLLTTPRPDAVAIERKFLAACKAKGVQHVVRLSAMGANPWASSALIRNHGKCEALLEESGLPWTILRPTIFMQNLAPYIGPTVAQESTLYAPAGNAAMPWVDTRDIAAVAGTVLTSKGHEDLVYEITGPEALTYTQVAECLSSQLGRQISYVNVPDGAAQHSMVGMGMSPWLAEGMITLYHMFRANGPTALALQTVERITGRAPRTLAAYLKENDAAFKSPKHAGATQAAKTREEQKQH
jgi:uncharacterized protein YbjT (DUF2867 family)